MTLSTGVHVAVINLPQKAIAAEFHVLYFTVTWSTISDLALTSMTYGVYPYVVHVAEEGTSKRNGGGKKKRETN